MSCWETPQIKKEHITFDLLTNLDISLIDSSSPTHFYMQTGTFSFIDFHSGYLLDFDHRVLDNLSESYHYPILISKTNRHGIIQYSDKFQTDLADWTSFKLLTRDFPAPVDDAGNPRGKNPRGKDLAGKRPSGEKTGGEKPGGEKI